MRLTLHDGYVDTETGELRRGGDAARLSSRERALLDYLALRPGVVVSTEELLRDVWGYGPSVVTRAVFHTMRRLRARVEEDATQPRMLLAEHGVGYRFVPPAPGPHPPPTPPSPTPAPSLHGREEDLRRVAEALTRPARLLHVVGPPGVGKTRLVREACPAPAWRFLPLEAEPTLGRLEGALVSALGLASPEALPAALEAGGVGLVLDGVERLPAGAERWLDPAAPPRVVVTGREAFGLPGERLVHLSRLSPAAGKRVLVDAVRLCLGPGAEPPEAELLAAVEALDGLPLALEVAAAQLHDLPLPQVLRRLTRGEPGSGPLDAALAVSWELAAPEVRAALVRLAVWEGAVPLEEARRAGVQLREIEAIARASLGEWVAGGRELRLFSVVRSFVRRTAAVAELDAARGARLAALGRHGRPSSLARLHEDGGRGAAELAAVLPELGAAADADPALPAPLLRALAVGATFRGGFATVAPLVRHRARSAPDDAERRALLAVPGPLEWSAALGMPAEEFVGDLLPPEAPGPDGAPPEPEERMLRLLHRWQWAQALLRGGQFASAATAFGELAEGLRAEGLLGLRGLAGLYRGSALRQLGHRVEALGALHDAAAQLDAAGDRRGLAELRNSEGVVRLDTGELDLARSAFVEAREGAVACGDHRLAMRVDGNLSIVERMRGDLDAAQRHARAVAEAAHRIGARDTEGGAWLNLAVSCTDAGRLDEAWVALEHARRLFAFTGSARSQVVLAVNWGLARFTGGNWDLDDLPGLYPSGAALGWRTALVDLLVWAGRLARGLATPAGRPSLPPDTPPDAAAIGAAWASVAAARAGHLEEASALRSLTEAWLGPTVSPYLQHQVRGVLGRAGQGASPPTG